MWKTFKKKGLTQAEFVLRRNIIGQLEKTLGRKVHAEDMHQVTIQMNEHGVSYRNPSWDYINAALRKGIPDILKRRNILNRKERDGD
jgi:hypothetical protein